MDYVNRFTSFMEKSEITNLGDICYTANTGRGHFSNRLALIVRDIDELKSKLAHVRENGFLNVTLKGIYYKEHKVIADNRKITDDTEISESGKKQLIREADTLIKELSSPVKQVDSILESLCDLYIKGADINWRNTITVRSSEEQAYRYIPLKESVTGLILKRSGRRVFLRG
jgi:polyketide synthase PksN